MVVTRNPLNEKDCDVTPGGMDRSLGVNVAIDLGDVHVAGVNTVSRDSMVVLDDGVEHVSENLVGVPVSSIDTTMLVVELNSTGNGLAKGEFTGLGHSPGQILNEIVIFLVQF